MSVDVVIAGGGAAGCVLATRLSEDEDRRVLLLEAGPDYTEIPSALADGLGHPPTASHNWSYRSVPDSSGREVEIPRGRVIGGSSTTNAAFALRGSPHDYDDWAARGVPGWSWDEVLPFFIRLERDLDYGDEAYHGTHGPIPIRRYRDGARSELAAALHDAIEASGVAPVLDHNAPGAVGVGPLPVNELDGKRMGVASTYLPLARDRSNLEIRGDAVVDSVVVSNGRATGVRLHDGETVDAGHVIVAAGAYCSPAILLRSGIGPADELHALGIEVVVALDGVGKNLIDHPVASIDMAFRGDPGTVRLMQTVATLHTENVDDVGAPDGQYFGVGPWADGDAAIWLLACALLQPKSRGSVRLRSRDADDPPLIDFGYHTHPDDLARHIELLRGIREVTSRPELSAFAEQVLNGPASDDRAELERHIRTQVWTYHHPVGTCAMGSVVNELGAVHDVERLSVIDASIMPNIPSANTHLPTVMIAERLASALSSPR